MGIVGSLDLGFIVNALDRIFLRIVARVRLLMWTSKTNYDKAMAILTNEQRVEADESDNDIKRSTTERIFACFGNKLQTIAVAPKSIREYFRDIAGTEVKCGMGYFIDHMITHHSEMPRKEFRCIQEVLDFPYDVRITTKGNDVNHPRLTFIARHEKGGWRVLTIGVDRNDLKHPRVVLEKSFSLSTKEKPPYGSKPQATKVLSSSCGGGGSPISHKC